MDDASPLFLMLLLVVFSGEWPFVDAASAAHMTALRSAVLKNYDRNQPPPGGPVKVTAFLTVINVDLDPYSKAMTVDFQSHLDWLDTRLMFNDSEVRYIPVYADEIWVPPLGVLHRGDLEDSSFDTEMCSTGRSGHVDCLGPQQFRTHCHDDESRWPYTDHNCTLRIASRLPVHQLTFRIWWITQIKAVRWNDWKDWKMKFYVETDAGKSIMVVSFQMKRHSLLQTAVFIVPAFVLALLTVSSWLLPSNCSERLLLATLCVFLDCVLIDNLSYAMPENGANVPHVALMYRDLLAVAAASLMATVGLRRLSSLRASETPACLPHLLRSTAARFLLYSPHPSLKQRDDAVGLVSEEEPAATVAMPSPSVQLARLIDRLGFVVSTAVCISTISIRLMA